MLAFAIHGKIFKMSTRRIRTTYKNNKFKISAPIWNEKLNFLMDHILYQIFEIILDIYLKNMAKRLLILQQEYR